MQVFEDVNYEIDDPKRYVNAHKPPIGIVPKAIWESERFNSLKGAIQRYLDDNCKIPKEWITEYNEWVDAMRR